MGQFLHRSLNTVILTPRFIIIIILSSLLLIFGGGGGGVTIDPYASPDPPLVVIAMDVNKQNKDHKMDIYQLPSDF